MLGFVNGSAVVFFYIWPTLCRLGTIALRHEGIGMVIEPCQYVITSYLDNLCVKY